MNKNLKITFIGDITVDRPLINASKVSEEEYDFKPVFENVRSLFEKSDYVVGNLETVFAGADKGYNAEYMLVNAPDDLAKAIVYGGIGGVTTANNHCMDQGIKGVIRTLDMLDNLGIDSYGTYRNKEEYNQIQYKVLNGTKIAIIAGTHSTNSTNIDEVIDKDNCFHVDVLKDQRIKYPNGVK
ncbi:MAG: CapA family protein, partial [Tissierellia bacterium]|nr:CapA family protein [Tissierellia bacterium]